MCARLRPKIGYSVSFSNRVEGSASEWHMEEMLKWLDHQTTSYVLWGGYAERSYKKKKGRQTDTRPSRFNIFQGPVSCLSGSSSSTSYSRRTCASTNRQAQYVLDGRTDTAKKDVLQYYNNFEQKFTKQHALTSTSRCRHCPHLLQHQRCPYCYY